MASELIDNKNGTYVCTVTSTTVGNEKFTFKLNDVASQSHVELEYIEKIPPLLPPQPPKNLHEKNPVPPLSKNIDKKVVVEFLGPFCRYCKGDIAGFDANYAKELVEKRKIAIFYKK